MSGPPRNLVSAWSPQTPALPASPFHQYTLLFQTVDITAALLFKSVGKFGCIHFTSLPSLVSQMNGTRLLAGPGFVEETASAQNKSAGAQTQSA